MQALSVINHDSIIVMDEVSSNSMSSESFYCFTLVNQNSDSPFKKDIDYLPTGIVSSISSSSTFLTSIRTHGFDSPI